MAYVLHAYQKQENLSDDDLVRELGTPLILRLALCKRPASLSGRFAEDVRELADYTLTDEALLAGVLRQVDALEKIAARPAVLAESKSQDRSGQSLAGLLAAARDREEPPEHETPPSNDADDARNQE